MSTTRPLLLAFLGLASLASATRAAAEAGARAVAAGPDTVTVQSGSLKLRGVIYRPKGHGPFPAVLFNHGSGHATGIAANGVHDHRHPELLGPVFARHGYLFLYLFRRGDGLSRGQGIACGDLMDQEFAARGQKGRNRIQLQVMDGDEMNDSRAGLAYLRGRPEVDSRRIAVVGHSFGGSLSVLMAGRETTLRAIVAFSPGGYSWDRSPELRARLLAAVDRTTVPILFIHASNDYAVAPGQALAAEMKRLGKAHEVKIYPAVGQTPDDGHDFIHLRVSTWEPDVFAFLDEHVRKPATPMETVRMSTEPSLPKPTAVYRSLEVARDTVEAIFRSWATPGDTAIHLRREPASFAYHYTPATARGWTFHVVVNDTSQCPYDILGNALLARGWVPDYGYSADGTDGTAMGYLSVRYLCVIEAQWDGGDATDTTYVPAPGCEVRATCVPRRVDDVSGP